MSSRVRNGRGRGATMKSDGRIKVLRRREPRDQAPVNSSYNEARTQSSDSSDEVTPQRQPKTSEPRKYQTKKINAIFGPNRASSRHDTPVKSVTTPLCTVDYTKYSLNLIKADFTWSRETSSILTRLTAPETGTPLVIGCVGAQGSGKSTLMSMLAKNNPDDMFRDYVFRPNAKEGVELGRHQTEGVNIYIDTDLNIVFLDAQPWNAMSQIFDAVTTERRFYHEFTTIENAIELESMQILSFMLNVCHLLIVTDDACLTPYTIEMFEAAFMCRPLVRYQLSNGQEVETYMKANTYDFNKAMPHVVFVQQKCRFQHEFLPIELEKRARILKLLFKPIKVKIQTGLSYQLFVHENSTDINSMDLSKLKDIKFTVKPWSLVNYFPVGELPLRSRDDPPPNTGNTLTSLTRKWTPEEVDTLTNALGATHPLRTEIGALASAAQKVVRKREPSPATALSQIQKQEIHLQAVKPKSVDHVNPASSEDFANQLVASFLNAEHMPVTSPVFNSSQGMIADTWLSKDPLAEPNRARAGQQPHQAHQIPYHGANRISPTYVDSMSILRTLLKSQKPGDLLPGITFTTPLWIEYAEQIWSAVLTQQRHLEGTGELINYHNQMP